MAYRYGKRYTDTVISHIDMVILDIGMEYGLMIWEMTVSIWSWISDIDMEYLLTLTQMRWMTWRRVIEYWMSCSSRNEGSNCVR